MASPASSAPRPVDAGSPDSQNTPAAVSSARVTCEVIAVTTSDDFLLELGEVLGGQASMRPVESLDGALEHLGNSRRTQLIAFDIRGESDVRGAIERVRARAPNITLLAFADGTSEPAETSNLQGSDVFALLPIPVDRRKTGAALEAAMSAAEKRAGARVAVAAQASAPQPAPAAEAIRRLPPMAVIAAGGVGLVLAIAVSAWLLMRGGEEAEIATAQIPAPVTETRTDEAEPLTTPLEGTLVQGTLDELLEKARLAMRQRRFTEPAGDNALVYFRSAIALDASNAEATDGLARIGGVMVARVEEALAANRIDEATAALAAAKSATSGDIRIATLEVRLFAAQVGAALTEGNFDRAASVVRLAQTSEAVPASQIAQWQADIARRQNASRVRRATELANERLRDGRLIEPAADSAKHYIQQLRELAPASGGTQRLAKDLANAFLRKARESSAAGRANETERWLGEARSAGVTAAEIATFQRELAVSRQRAAAAEGDRLAQLARERVKQGRLIEPANDSAAHYLNALRESEESHSAIAPLSRELAAKLVDRAADAARGGSAAQVDADLAAARRWGADAKDVQAVRQLAVNTSSEASAKRQVSLQKQLKRSRYVPPEYPERALERGASGSVTIDYVVDVNGEPRDLKVTASQPEGVFDRAALSAVRRWRYEPVIVDEVPVEIPTRTIIRFEAPKE